MARRCRAVAQNRADTLGLAAITQGKGGTLGVQHDIYTLGGRDCKVQRVQERLNWLKVMKEETTGSPLIGKGACSVFILLIKC